MFAFGDFGFFDGFDGFAGWDILKLLQKSINSRFSGFYGFIAPTPGDTSSNTRNTNENDKDNVNLSQHNGDSMNFFEIGENGGIDLSNLEISAIHTHDTASVYLKQSEDNEIRFVPFRKPIDSWCSSRDYYFETDCVNVHNVRSMSFGNNELSFILAGSYPRLIEVSKDTEIILNDRIFEVEDYFNNELNKKDTRLREVQTSENYQTGEKFCANSIEIERIKENDSSNGHIMNKLIINGGCYGLLYLPASSIFFQQKSFQLLASEWSSIVIDSNIYTPEMIIAAENFASIIFRSSLTALNLKLVITDESYVEFKKIREATHVQLVTHEGSQIYIPTMNDIERADVAARNRMFLFCFICE